MKLIATRVTQELYELNDGTAVIVDHNTLTADFPPSIGSALKQGYWEVVADYKPTQKNLKATDSEDAT